MTLAQAKQKLTVKKKGNAALSPPWRGTLNRGRKHLPQCSVSALPQGMTDLKPAM